MKNTPTQQPLDDAQRLKRAFVALDKLQTKLNALEAAKIEPIAVIGMSCRFPGGANNPEDYWKLLQNGVNAIREVPAERWNIEDYYDPETKPGKINTRHGGFLNTKVYDFDPQFFGIAPREATQLDPQQRLLLEVTWEALENANIVPDHLYGSATGVFIGIGSFDYAVRQFGKQAPSQIGAYAATGSLLSPAAGRLSYILGLTGPSTIVDTACSSSLVALHLACQSLRQRESNLVLCGGVGLLLSPELSIYFSAAGMTSPDGRCKTFDESANGYVRGEGCGVLVLKRLSDAQANGDTILALIRGTAINQDGPSGGLTVPSGPSQEQVIRQALATGNIDPHQVDYIEAHGTGTSLGDPIEVNALCSVFGKQRDQPLLIGSVKTNIGHLEAAAGMAGLIKIILALQHQEIPPHLHFKQPSSKIRWEAFPIAVPTSLTPWPLSATRKRLAGISSFGFSGTNGHAILEEAPTSEKAELEPSGGNRPLHLLTFSAKTEPALKELVERYEKYLSDTHQEEINKVFTLAGLEASAGPDPAKLLADICFTANICRSHFEYRLASITSSITQLREQLSAVLTGQTVEGLQMGSGMTTSPKIAFLFTGQGSQYVNMGRQLYDTSPVFRQTLDQCDEILRPLLDKSLLEILFSDTNTTDIDETLYTQPALFALEYALAQLWLSWGVKPTLVMGHSIGEYVATCVAGVFTLADGLKLIATRARLMHNLPREGEMRTVFTTEARVTAAMQPYHQHVSIAALNGPESIVISGQREAILAIAKHFEAAGIQTKSLTVSHAFHSPLMEPMLAEFAQVLKEISFSPPQIELVSNLTGKVVSAEITSPDYWCHHLRQPVQFAASINTLHEHQCEIFIEMGPRPALLGMGRQCLPEDVGTWLPSLRPGQPDWQSLLTSLSELYVRGVHIDWSGFDCDYPRRRVTLPTYPFQRKHYSITIPPTSSGTQYEILRRLHPLIDKKIPLPLRKETLFESFFHTDALPLLIDHQVFDKVVVSGASHLSLILGATEQLAIGNSYALEDIFFQHALAVPDAGCTVQLLVSFEEENPEKASFNLLSFTDPQTSVTHVTGTLLTSPLPLPTGVENNYQTVKARCTQHFTGVEYYQIQLERRIYLGPAYQWMEWVRRGDNEAVCQIRLPEEVLDADQYQLHPGLIDTCFGLLTVSAPIQVTGTFVPFSVEQVCFYQRPQAFPLWSHAQLRAQPDDRRLMGDIRLFDQAGRLLAEFIGFQGAQADQERFLEKEHQTDFGDWFYEIGWQPQQLASNFEEPRRNSAEKWLILADQQGLGMALAQRLQQQGEPCVLVFSKTPETHSLETQFLEKTEFLVLNPTIASDFVSLVSNHRLRGIVHLWSLDGNLTDLPASQRLINASTLHLIQALVKHSGVQSAALSPLWLVTRGGQAVGTTTSLQVHQSSLWGLGRVIALEHPELRTICLDLDPTAENAAHTLFQELRSIDQERQITWRQGLRQVARWQPVSLPPPSNPVALREDATYLITGGTGVLGLKVAQWLVKQGARHLLLLSRRGASSSVVQDVIQQMEKESAQVLTLSVDISNLKALRQALDSVQHTLPPLRGVIHAAGTLEDGMLMNQTWAQFDKVFASKVYGAWHLHQYTADLALDFFVMFSSATSVLGNPGQGNYAAANAFLDGLAHYRRQLGLVATSINWGPWEAGMATGLERLSKQGFKPIPLDKGLAALARILSFPTSQVSVIPCDWRKYLSQFTWENLLFAHFAKTHTPTKSPSQSTAGEFLQKLKQAPAKDRHHLLIKFVSDTVQQVIGLETLAGVTEKPLRELGMDSLMAVEIRNRLGKGLDASLPVSLLFNYPTLGEVVGYLEKEVIKVEVVVEEAVVEEKSFEFLDGLSQAELEELINRELENG